MRKKSQYKAKLHLKIKTKKIKNKMAGFQRLPDSRGSTVVDKNLILQCN